jgi:hypothetical protein
VSRRRANHETTTLHDEALRYFRRGWCILPCRGKRPACRWADYQSQRPDEGELRELFAQRDLTGLGVLPGSVSGGLAVRDWDRMSAYRRWADGHPRLAQRIPTVKTRRGRHLYFLGPEGFEDLGDGELRADPGHFVVLPPSLHPSGGHYEWVIPLPEGDLPSVNPAKAGLLLPNSVTQHGPTRPNTTHPIEVGSVGPCCVTHPSDDPVEQAISVTLPTGKGQRNRAIFEFARRVKALPEYRDLSLLDLISLVQRWHERALPFIGTKDLDTTLKDFAHAWEKISDPADGCFVEALFEEVRHAPPHSAAKQFADEGHRLLVGLCAALQRYNGAKPFALSCRVAARLLGIDSVQANRMIQTLEALKVLRRTSTGKLSTRRASEFLFLARDEPQSHRTDST